MQKINWQYVIYAAAGLFGIYVFAVAVKMKITGKVSAFVASLEELRRCKDESGFVEAVSLKMMGFGLVVFCFGALSIANELWWKFVMFKVAALGVFLLVCGLFVICLRKAKETYLT